MAQLTGKASAPGKIIISGEHSVVYGHPVLAMAINKRITANFTATRMNQPTLSVKANYIDGDETKTALDCAINDESVANNMDGDENNEFKLFKHIWADMRGRWTKDGAMVQQGGSIEIHVVTEIPLSSGLGSSAAWGASLSAALLHSLHFVAIGAPFDAGKEKEFVWAYTNFLEKLYHGSPSGCDAAVSIHGGCIFFQRATPPGLTQVKPLPRCKINAQNIIVVNTNAKKNTKALVTKVKAFKDSCPEEFTELMNTLGDVTSEITECLQEQVVDKFAFLDYVSMS